MRTRPALVTPSVSHLTMHDQVSLELEKIRVLARHILEDSRRGDAGVLADLIEDCARRADAVLDAWAAPRRRANAAPSETVGA